MEKALTIALPLLRLLAACLLLILSPLYLGINRLSPGWVLLPCVILTYISCTTQGYRSVRLVSLCTLSVLVTLAVLYGGAYLAAGFVQP